jgi:YD repeat-containing protein
MIFYNYLGVINQIDSKDSNGNVISYLWDNSGNMSSIKDSLGRVVTIGYSLVSYGSGLATTLPTSVTYTDSNGLQQTTTFGYTTQTIAPTFSQPPPSSMVANQPPSGSAPYISSITLPNNRSYLMQYNNFGELTKISYPAGGYTRYAYGAVQGWYVLDNYSTSGDVRGVTNSYACSDPSGSCSPGDERPTTYSATRQWSNSNNTAMTVTDALGNYTAYTFSDAGDPQSWVAGCEPPSPRELTRTMYDSSGTKLRSVATDYNTMNCGNPMFPIRRTTTLGNGLVAKTELDYETLSSAPGPTDNVIEERSFDYGSLTVPAVKHRYAYLQVNPINNVDYTQAMPFILDRRASEQVYDSHTGSDVLMAQTTYEYDNYTAALAASGATQHDPAFAASYATRGNVTAINHWRNTDGAWLTTRNQYDEAGNVLSTADPLNHVTQFSYVDNFTDGINHNGNAYVTQITYPATNGVNHIERKQYFYSSGLVAASCGQNFPGASVCANTYTAPQPDYATYVYDAMNRQVQLSVGDGGGKSISYNDIPRFQPPRPPSSRRPRT